MSKKKRSEVCIVSPSKTVVKWKSNKESSDGTFFASALNYIVILPSAAITFVMAGVGPELYAAGGAYAVVSQYFITNLGHRFSTNLLLRAKAEINIMDSLKASKKKRKLLETYFIRHDYSFKGIVTKEQECLENKATHQVKTYLAKGFLVHHIEQEIDELPEFMWDKTLNAIDETMTKPVCALPVIDSAVQHNPTRAVPMYDRIFNSNPIKSK